MKPKRKKLVAYVLADEKHTGWVAVRKTRREFSGWCRREIVKLVEHDAKRERLIKELIDEVEAGATDRQVWDIAAAIYNHEKGTK